MVEEEQIPSSLFSSSWPSELVELRGGSQPLAWSIVNAVDYSEMVKEKRAELESSVAARTGPDDETVEGTMDSTPAPDEAKERNVQQKITPLETLLPSASDELRFYRQLHEQRHGDHGKLILVTSLLEKIPNIGGEFWVLMCCVNDLCVLVFGILTQVLLG